MRLSCVVISASFAIMGLLGSPTIASAKETSTCEALAGALSGAEKDSFLKKMPGDLSERACLRCT